jgi:hypothetical protein
VARTFPSPRLIFFGLIMLGAPLAWSVCCRFLTICPFQRKGKRSKCIYTNSGVAIGLQRRELLHLDRSNREIDWS